MKHFLKAMLSFGFISLTLIGCSSTVDKNTTPTYPGKRINIPQEKASLEHPTPPPKVVPYTYNTWLAVSDNLAQVRDYENFLNKNQVGHIIPSYELMRTARDWQKCGRSEYMVPHREIWQNQVPTLKVFKYLIAAKILTDFTVTSVYRDLTLNQCAGGASSSKHLFNSAIDFRIGPENPDITDYAAIENTKFRLCQFWKQYGPQFNMGLGLYASGQIHVDTQGYRTWGPDLSKNSSMCNY
ncbi:peptidase M15 [Acinetobacter sp. ANC 4558]|uniref:D-Ala-D-Ala carboxypeptidase family metallohydrolase n=1 Tax=Acinetobacter sp. ANC 4558 TaxID=1977876 RepID=UPI000A3444FB|nr:D-Ala-D-Ala carboxypeptidase family metallohydrolase [Acinetobacter sp. ANC 4558]OTG88332.1 peptidase M15 [Acinetobacter sp. ANC 4558]